MPELKERFRVLDQLPAPNLHPAIQSRAQRRRQPDHLVSAEEEAWRAEERSRRLTTRLTQAVAAVTLVALGIGIVTLLRLAQTNPPADKKTVPAPSITSGLPAAPGLESVIRMVDPATGWVAINGPDNHILRTRDGGAHWRDVTPQAVRPDRLATPVFVDGTVAWLLSRPRDGSGRAEIWRTLDGGQTWQRIGSFNVVPWYAGPRQAAALTFVDRQHGWLGLKVFSQDGGSILGMAIYRTTDGGTHWIAVSVGPALGGHSTASAMPSGCFGTLLFANQRDGWVSGVCGQALGQRLFASHDGGLSWKAEALPAEPGLPSVMTWQSSFYPCSCSAISFSSSRDASVSLRTTDDPAAWSLYFSHDGGASWSTTRLPGQPDVAPVLIGNRGWVVVRRCCT